MPGAAQRAREAARQAREGRGAQVEGGARLHDGARALAAAVRGGHVPRQVRAQLELLQHAPGVRQAGDGPRSAARHLPWRS